jgi:hypothetical protein
MIKNCLFALALLSLALAGGCATGGNGVLPTAPTIAATGVDPSAIYPGQSVTLTAMIGTPAALVAVNWGLGPAATCAGTPSPCGTLTPTTVGTATYVAPAAPIAGLTVTAALVSNSSAIGTLGITVQAVSVVVTPTVVTVGQNLVQQFTAVTVPDGAPQTFTWSVSCTNGANCGTIVQDQNTSGLAVYTAGSVAQSVTVAATSTVTQPSPGIGQSKVTVAASRLPADTYSFQFSGYDNSNNPVAAAGTFILAANGTITAGVEDVLSASGPNQYPIASVSYTPTSSNNNLGTLTLALTGGPTNTYTAVLTSSGIIRMIESDAFGTGSGVLQKSVASQFNSAAQTFAFGFTGADKATGGNRVGYVGMLPMDGSGNIGNVAPALLDSNDNGSPTTVCGAPPCTVAGAYSKPNASLPTWWNMTLTSGAITQHFDFFVSGGQTQTTTGSNPLTLYAISTDPVDAAQPALSGSMVFQVPLTYNNAAFDGISVSALTGANANVSLTLGVTDGTSGGTGGTGGFTGTYDQNSNGTIVSVPPPSLPPPAQQCQPPTVCAFSNTYVASSSNTGRYVFQMLGNPNASPVVPPLPFVLYASGANRGFLLDQSSSAVMTGSMTPQPAAISGSYSPSEMPGTFAAAPISDSNSSPAPAVENLLLTSPGGQAFNLAGTQNPNNVSLAGTYTMTFSGTGTITLTAPSAATYVIYAIDATTISNPANSKFPNYAITDFMMMGTCTPQGSPATCSSGPPSPIIFAQE